MKTKKTNSVVMDDYNAGYDSGYEDGINNGREMIHQLEELCEKYSEALRLIAAPRRSDGTYNRCREACQKIAEKALK